MSRNEPARASGRVAAVPRQTAAAVPRQAAVGGCQGAAPQSRCRLLSRRRFLAKATALSIVAAETARGTGAGAAPPAGEGRYAKLLGNRALTSRYLGEVEVVARVEDTKVFTEGPACDRAGKLYFTNTSAEKILLWDPRQPDGLSVFREQSGAANGLAFDAQGRLLACEGGGRRVTRTDLRTGRLEVLADGYHGFPLAAPNDLCLDAAGRIYFTSRPGVEDPSQGNVNAVYRIDPDGTLEQVLRWPQIHMPNGIVTSPDDKLIYVIEAHPDQDRHRDIRAYELTPGGQLVRERVLIDFYPGRSGDGMCIDAEGNLYVAAGLHATRRTSETLDTRPGIHVISPAGQLLAFRETPEDTITNCTFGGPQLRTLYVTCGRLLLRIPTRIPGKPGYRPGQ